MVHAATQADVPVEAAPPPAAQESSAPQTVEKKAGPKKRATEGGMTGAGEAKKIKQ